jgi:hypothetical protein
VSAQVPPVRIAVVPGGGSGMEQEVVDRISSLLQDNSNIALSTVNPDWYVVCNIIDRQDVAGANVRVNGTVTIKSTDGHVINTVSMQTNKQDFALSPGTPLNKQLVEKAVAEVIDGLVVRAITPIQQAVDLEMQVREKIIQALNLSDQDKYDEALPILMTISPDTPNFRKVRSLIAEFQMEQQALDLIKQAQSLGKRDKYSQAISLLKDVDAKSKRYKIAKSLIARYRSCLSSTAKINKTKTFSISDSERKVLEAKKRALDAERRAIEAEEASLKAKSKPVR